MNIFNFPAMIIKQLHFILLFALVCTLLASCNKGVNEIYVSPNGHDKTGDGSIENPFATPERARNEIRELKKEGKSNFKVNFREGVYFLEQSFELSEEDTGEQASIIEYTAYRDEKVIFHGGKILKPKKASLVEDPQYLDRLTPSARNSIMVIDLSDVEIDDIGKLHPVGFARPYMPAWAELFINDNPCQLARWPNDSAILIGDVIDSGSIPRDGDFSERGAVFEFNSDRPKQWKDHNNIWISGYFARGWAEDAVELAEIDTIKDLFKTKQTSLYGFDSGKDYLRWYAFNVLEEIDMPGEYYIDKENRKAYFYPEGDLKTIEVSTLTKPMISLKGASNIHISDITFKCSRGIGIYMERTENVIISGCTFHNLGQVAVCMGKGIQPFETLSHEGSNDPASEIIGSFQQHIYHNTTFNREAGRNNGVVNCLIYNTGAGGIHLSGGDRITLEAGENYVENCIIHDFNRIETSYRAAINISGVGNRISHCEIYNAPSMAILLKGNDHIIEYNEVHHVCQDVFDQGALYYGRDPSEQGHHVRYNFFHHFETEHITMGVYHDDGACGMQVYGNVFYKAGRVPALIGGGMDNPYTNNIFIDSKIGVHIDRRLQTWTKERLEPNGIYDQRLKAVNYSVPPYSERYPNLAKYWEDDPAVPKRNTVSKNVFYNVEKPFRPTASYLDSAFMDDNLITNENPGFIDEKNMNFNLQESSIIYEKIPGFEAIPFDSIGVIDHFTDVKEK